MVADGNWPRWLIASAVGLSTMCATLDRRTCVVVPLLAVVPGVPAELMSVAPVTELPVVDPVVDEPDPAFPTGT